jgi:hypothetical protein
MARSQDILFEGWNINKRIETNAHLSVRVNVIYNTFVKNEVSHGLIERLRLDGGKQGQKSVGPDRRRDI